MKALVDASGIRWLDRSRNPARPDASWAWAFAYDVDGRVLPETEGLIEAIGRYGRVEIGGFEYTLGGRDGRLLQRRMKK